MQWWIYAGILIAALLAGYLRAVTIAGAITGILVAATLFYTTGYTGLILLATFFISGTLVTRYRGDEKRRKGFADADKPARTASQVLANSGAAVLCSIGIWLFPQQHNAWLLGVAAAFSSATADTWSSELGVIWGKTMVRPFSKTAARTGDNGVISVEGTLAGVAGSVLIALIFHLLHFPAYGLLIAAGLLGNLADTCLGELLENKGRMSNDAVNFTSTSIATVLALTISML